VFYLTSIEFEAAIMNKLEEMKSKIFANPQNQTLFELFDLDADEIITRPNK
jgi:hypothetical protein